MALSVETVEMDRGKGEIDPLQRGIEPLKLIGLEAKTAGAVEPQIQLRHAAEQIVERCGIGVIRGRFDDGLAHAPGQVRIAGCGIDGARACRAVEKDRATLQAVNRVPVDRGFEIGTAQGLFGQDAPAGGGLGGEKA